MTIWVSSRFRAPALAKEKNIVRAVSLLAPWDEFPKIEHLDDDLHLKLAFEDVEAPAPGVDPPMKDHAEQLIGVVQGWTREDPMLIHCWAGVSRSSASAFITACLHNPDADEFEIANAVRNASETAKPNQRLVRFADDLLGREGRMVAAVEAMSGHVFCEEAEPFSIPSVYEKTRGHWV